MIRVCFVCMGNICRSPTAEGIFLHLLGEHGLMDHFSIDSAGTGGWHAGQRPDRRSIATAERQGVHLPSLARRFLREDFERFDHVIAMDQQNVDDLMELQPGPDAAAKITLLRSWDPATAGDGDVPDPYYGGADGFQHVYDICMAGCRGLLTELRRRHGF